MTLAQAYHAHHFNCPTCVSAGIGNGQRCPTGLRLWSRYQAEVLKPAGPAAFGPGSKK